MTAKQERKRGLMQRLLTGKRRFPAFQLPWSSATFGQVLTTMNAQNPWPYDMLHFMKTWLNPKIEVGPSPIEGKGLFANEPIAKGEQLTRNGEDDYVIMTDEEFRAFTTTASSYDAIALGNGTHRVSKVSRKQDPSNYGNHSCDPTAELIDSGLIARRDIKAGEEITSNYALHSGKDWSMVCNCGAQNCRKIVRGML
jgi:uncharacterized protein